MAAPEYDFFATGPRPTPPAGPSSDRFGTPAVPQGPVQHVTGPVLPQAPAVNQFGLPVDTAIPTGPLAAPGYGAAPVHGGLAAGYDDAPAAWDPAASLATRAHSRAAAQPADTRPGPVLAAGIISIVLGVLSGLAAAFILLGYLAAKGEIEAAVAGNPEIAGLDEFGSALLTGVLVIGLVIAAVSVLYIVIGVMTVRGRRWAAWTLVALSAVSLLFTLWQVLGGGNASLSDSSSWVGVGTTVAVLLLLTVGEGGRWLRRA